ncbi:MAG: hypothetical protein H7Z72_23585 [Bacteroidetes bacterium]|nr:hypothetical protein [Fibrella sp.]
MNRIRQVSQLMGLAVLLLVLNPDQSVRAQQVDQPPTYQRGITISYFGDALTHPGAVVSVEQSILPGRYQLVFCVNVGGYVHKRNHTALFTNLQIGQRYRFNSGFYVEQYVGLGYFRSYLNGDGIYEVSNGGAVSRASNGGQGYRMPMVSVGVGWDLSQGPHARPLRLFVRPTVFWQAPFNGYALPHIALQTGITKLIP